MSKKRFDLKNLHNESLERIAARQREQTRKKENHLQTHYDVDVLASYEASKAILDENARDYDEQLEHLEEVLSAGAAKYDH